MFVGVLTMWWFVLTRALVEATLQGDQQGGPTTQSRQDFRNRLRLLASARSGSAVGTGFGWDFYISYFGENSTNEGESKHTDAALFSSDLHKSLENEQHGGQERYPSGCFLDAEKLKSELIS